MGSAEGVSLMEMWLALRAISVKSRQNLIPTATVACLGTGGDWRRSPSDDANSFFQARRYVGQ
jgi:hypothetical protein